MTRTLCCLVLLGGWATCTHAQPPGLVPGDTYHVVFVTSNTTNVVSDRSLPPPSFDEFGGVSAADWVTTFNAASAGTNNPFGLSNLQWTTGDANGTSWNFIDTHWQAILSDSGFSDGNPGGNDAFNRLAITAPVYNTQGDLVATDHADMWDGSIGAPIKYDEFGNEVTGNLDVWTGTNSGGFWSGSSCDDWDNPSSNAQGELGSVGFTDPRWLLDGVINCNKSARLYALSPELTVLQPGDADGDFDVDGHDLLAWQRGYGTGPSNARLMDGDLDGDGNVDSDDLAEWLTNYGATNPLATNTKTIPEPSAIMLTLVAISAMRIRLRRETS